MKKYITLIILILSLGASSSAQKFTMHLRAHVGASTIGHDWAGDPSNYRQTPDLFIAGIQIVPQFNFKRISIGVIDGFYFTEKRFHVTVGPTVSVSLKKINLSIDHLWTTQAKEMLGGGARISVGKLDLGLTAHKDYHGGPWWLQMGVGVRITK